MAFPVLLLVQEKLPVVRLTPDLTTAALGEPERVASPDGRWLVAFYKVSTGVRVALLYKQAAGTFTPATFQGRSLDDAAWLWWAHRNRGRRVPELDEGPRLVHFIGWSQGGRLLELRLTGPRMRPQRIRLDLKNGVFALR